MDIQEVMRERRSVKQYDADHQITDEDLRELFELVVLSPSSFNLQHWRFVVVRDSAGKAALQKAAMGQPQVAQASAVVVVAGKLTAHEDAARINEETPPEIRDRVVSMITGFYADKPQSMRDEAIRGASLGAMSLMLAAKSMGLATGPMIGFDPSAVADLLGLGDDLVPVMMIVLGKQDGDLRPRAMRLPLSEVVKLERMDGAGL